MAGPKRSIVLSGGGMRVSYQSGVLKALAEEGLEFFHGDGTSWGGMTLAMMLSGLTPDEMCERWRTLRVKDFVSFMPFASYLNMSGAMAMGSADGIVQKVFPHLGIDIARINRADGMLGTFNVCNYTRKVNEVFRRDQVDVDLLVAGMSLPIFMPPVRRGNAWYTDSAWIRDANPLEAVRQGADEIWIVWTLGNSPEYRPGAFRQYIQMLEMSANGALFEDFEKITEINQRIANGERLYGRTTPVRVHVISPERPLPLDPDLYFGNVDAPTLIDMGYRDARRYLAQRRDEGVPLTPEATAMKDGKLGLTFRETMSGHFALGETDPKAGEAAGKKANTTLAMHANVEVPDLDGFVADTTHTGAITGHIDFTPFGKNIPGERGVFRLFSPTENKALRHMVYELAFQHDNQAYYLAGRKEVQNDKKGTDLWNDTTTLLTRLHKGGPDGPVVGAGVLKLGVADLAKLTSTIHVTNAAHIGDHARALATFGGFFMGSLWDSYGSKEDVIAGRRPLRAAPPETHQVIANDGVALRLTRYRGGNRGPVMLVHCIGVSSDMYSLDTVETNLLEFLCEAGYDVWLLDFRFSILLPDAAVAHCFDDVATRDYPAAVAAVLRLTGRPSLQVVAHGVGSSTLSMALLAGLTGVRAAVCSQVSTHLELPLLSRAKAALRLTNLAAAAGVTTMTADVSAVPELKEELYDHLLRLHPVDAEERCDSAVCRRITVMYGELYQHAQLSAATHASLDELFGVVSVRAFGHLAALGRAGHLVNESGDEVYLPHLDRMALPILFVHGEKNECVLPRATEITLEQLTQANGPSWYSRTVIPEYGHVDCIIGQDASRDVYPKILDHLRATS